MKTTSTDTKMKLSNFKLASRLVGAKAANQIAQGIGKGGQVLGYFLLGASIINGINNSNDTSSPAIAGGQKGLDVGTGTVTTLDKSVFSAARKLGKAASALGKDAGAIGDLADAAVGIFSPFK